MKGKIDSHLKKRVDLVWVGVILGLVYWIWQSYRDVILQENIQFDQSLFFPGLLSLATRVLVISVFLLFCIHGKYIQEKILEDKSARSKSTAFWIFLIAAVGFIVLYWIIDAFQVQFIKLDEQAQSEWIRQVFGHIPDLIPKLISVLFIVVLIFFTYYLFYNRKKAEKAIKAAHDQLARSRENLYKIVSNDVDALFVINDKGNVVFVNKSAENMFRTQADQLIGKPLNYPIQTDCMQELDIVNTAGMTVTVEAVGVEIEWENEKAILASLRDITERKHIEQQRRHFLSLISARLKSPVVGIMGAIENMLDGLAGTLSEKQREYLLLMRESVTTKYHLINDLLMALRLETGGETVQIEPTALSDIIEKAIKTFQSTIKHKKITLNLKKLQTNLMVQADPQKLEKVLRQVIHNAVKFTDEGTIDVQTDVDGRSVKVRVQDTGRGMSDSTLKTLFDMEKNLPSLHDASTGLGFGMYMAKKLMFLQNGDITAESTLGKGSQITITIPLYE